MDHIWLFYVIVAILLVSCHVSIEYIVIAFVIGISNQLLSDMAGPFLTYLINLTLICQESIEYIIITFVIGISNQLLSDMAGPFLTYLINLTLICQEY
jgi:hypothetical protein